jgi:hypothetical protein
MGARQVTLGSMPVNLRRVSKALTRSSWSVCTCHVTGSDVVSENN